MLLVPLRTQNLPVQAQVLGPVQAAVRVVAVPVGSLVVWVPAQDPVPDLRAPGWLWTRSVEAPHLRNRGTVGTGTRKGAAQARVQEPALDPVLVSAPVAARELVSARVRVAVAVPASGLASGLALAPGSALASVPAWAGTQR